MGLASEKSGFDSGQEQDFSSQSPDGLWCPLTSYPIGTGDSLPGAKWLEEGELSWPLKSNYISMELWLIKHRDYLYRISTNCTVTAVAKAINDKCVLGLKSVIHVIGVLTAVCTKISLLEYDATQPGSLQGRRYRIEAVPSSKTLVAVYQISHCCMADGRNLQF
jgi:hypothetical protein